MNTRNEKIAVVGAGLCGTLMAIRLAEYGYQVDLYERRPDLRKEEMDAGRSINLALSHRGLGALDMIGMRETVSEQIIPMYGRLVHPVGRESTLYRYSGREGEYINSVSRPGLNATLLDKAETFDNINIQFETKVSSMDIASSTLHIMDGESTIQKSYDVVLGSDGAGSAIRRSYQRRGNKLRFDFQQKWLSTGYKELNLPPDEHGKWQLETNALHIWPRDGHMMIALPNLDGSFTLTLFIPFEGKSNVELLDTDDNVMAFMQEHYAMAIENIPDLIEQWHDNPTSSLGTVKCYPWNYGKTVLMGDAAHAIVPFYGQGMNCAMEDCVVLDKLIQRHNHDWSMILSDYQVERKADTDAIADLAEDNFYEMRDATADPVFNRKRKLELRLESERNDYYSKYSLVTFRPDLPYQRAMIQGRLQNKYLYELAQKHEDVSQLDLDTVMSDLQKYLDDRISF